MSKSYIIPSLDDMVNESLSYLSEKHGAPISVPVNNKLKISVKDDLITSSRLTNIYRSVISHILQLNDEDLRNKLILYLKNAIKAIIYDVVYKPDVNVFDLLFHYTQITSCVLGLDDEIKNPHVLKYLISFNLEENPITLSMKFGSRYIDMDNIIRIRIDSMRKKEFHFIFDSIKNGSMIVEANSSEIIMETLDYFIDKNKNKSVIEDQYKMINKTNNQEGEITNIDEFIQENIAW